MEQHISDVHEDVITTLALEMEVVFVKLESRYSGEVYTEHGSMLPDMEGKFRRFLVAEEGPTKHLERFYQGAGLSFKTYLWNTRSRDTRNRTDSSSRWTLRASNHL